MPPSRFIIATLLALTSAVAINAATNTPAPACELAPGAAILAPDNLPAPVSLAIADLQRDLQKVLGSPSPVVRNRAALKGHPSIIILAPSDKLTDPRVNGVESHAITTREIDGVPCVILQGADMRGLIYAIYTFSEKNLGVPPLWYWSGWTAVKRTSVTIPANSDLVCAPASVRWRAWLNNDTDFLTPWRRSNPANNAAVYETILRLKYNTYEVESIADLRPNAPLYTPSADAAAASARGLIITFHHTSPLGALLGKNLVHWNSFWTREQKAGRDPRPAPPPLSIKNTDDLFAFWRYHAETVVRSKMDVVWTIVFRGSGDIPFWQTFADSPKDEKSRGEIIGAMLRAQVAIIKKVTGDSTPPMRTTLYNENSNLLADGALQLPDEPTLIWNFVAARRDHFLPADARTAHIPAGQPVGYYLNFQFSSSGSHLAAAEGFWKMALNYRMLAALAPQKRLAFTVVNAGNNREHLAELSANAAMLWRFDDFDPDTFIRDYCAQYFFPSNPELAAQAAALYRDYYNAYWCQKKPDLPGFDRQYLFQDQRYARAAEMILKKLRKKPAVSNPLDGHPLDNPDTGSMGFFRVEKEPGDANQLATIVRGTAASRDAFAQVARRADVLREKVPAPNRQFFDNNLRIPAHVMAKINVMLNELALANTAALSNPNAAGDTHAHLAAAQAAALDAKKFLDSTDTGVFANWHKSDNKFLLPQLIDSIASLRSTTPTD